MNGVTNNCLKIARCYHLDIRDDVVHELNRILPEFLAEAINGSDARRSEGRDFLYLYCDADEDVFVGKAMCMTECFQYGRTAIGTSKTFWIS